MSEQFESLSVIELRQKAKEMGVKLGAGINKKGIVEKLKEAAAQMEAAAPAPAPVPEEPAPQPEAAPAPEPPARAAAAGAPRRARSHRRGSPQRLVPEHHFRQGPRLHHGRVPGLA